MTTSLPQTVDAALPCAEQSRLAGESLAGSAAGPVHHWLLIEHRGAWARDVYNSLPAALAEPLKQLCLEHPTVRPQLIRRKRAHGPLSAFVVRADTGVVERRALTSLDAWAEVDWRAVLAGEPLGRRQLAPLYLVCTHGRRDRCCAVRGVPLLKALDAQPDVDVWQTSHIGGHRLAPTLVYLPHGICYGRVEADEAEALARAHSSGQLYRLDRCRGQTRMSAHAQAAALWWRAQHNDVRLDAIEGVSVRGHAPRPKAATGKAATGKAATRLPQLVEDSDAREVLLLTDDGPSEWLLVRKRVSPPLRSTSCGADKQLPIARYQVSLLTDAAGPAAAELGTTTS